MADFKVHRRNVGTADDPHLEVLIALDSYETRDGHPAVIAECAGKEELKEQLSLVIQRLCSAVAQANALLEEND